MAQSADNTMGTMNIVCDEGKECDVKRTLLPRIKAIYSDPRLVHEESITVEHLPVESLQKIVQYLEHYPENPVNGNGEIQYTEWDHSFFADLNGTSFVRMNEAGKMLEVDGFFDYIMNYLKNKFMALSVGQQVAMGFVNSVGGEDALIAMANFLLKQ